MEVLLIKTPQGPFIPADEDFQEACKRFKVGQTIRADIKAMLDVGFDAWEPEQKEYKGMPAQKNKTRFRKDCTIAAGFYTTTYDINGNVKLEAKSISFANMDDAEFEKVYSAVADVLLQKILRNYTRKDLDSVVDQMMGFL